MQWTDMQIDGQTDARQSDLHMLLCFAGDKWINSWYLVKAGLPFSCRQCLKIMYKQCPLEVSQGLTTNLPPRITTQPSNAWNQIYRNTSVIAPLEVCQGLTANLSPRITTQPSNAWNQIYRNTSVIAPLEVCQGLTANLTPRITTQPSNAWSQIHNS